MTLPNFLIIGAAKGGTTAVYDYLRQHPSIYMSTLKETNFFAFEDNLPDFRGPGDDEAINRLSLTTLDAYEARFDGVGGETAIGEASPLYLYDECAPARIHKHVADARLIAILRHPVDRAYSAFLHTRRDGREPIADFVEALRREDARVEAGWEHIWHYGRMGFYHAQLERYYDTFDARQIAIYLYDDFRAAPRDVLRDMYRFLSVDDAFVPDMSIRPNVASITMRGQTLIYHPTPPLPETARQWLDDAYRDDIRRLQGLIERDLSGWRASSDKLVAGAG